MSLRDRVPVEPLAPERWHHLEGRIVAHVGDAVAASEPPRRRWLWLPALAAAGVAAAVAVWPSPHHSPPAPLTVTAAADGAHLALGDVTIDATPGSQFTVTRPAGGVLVTLATGVVSLEVAPRRGRPPLVVAAGDVHVRVVGTAFTVRRDPTVSVEVHHGLVEVERAGATAAVAADQRWSLDPSGRPTVAAIAAVALGAAAAPTAPPGLGPAPAHLPALPDRSAVAPPAPVGDDRDRRVERPRPSGERPRPRDPVRPAAPADPVVELRRALAAPGIAAAPPLPAGEADPIAAFTRESIDGRGPRAASALWGLARTQWGRGRAAEALRALDAYQRRFPRGAERDPVAWLRLRILCERDLDDRCRAAAHSYTAVAEDGPRRALAVRVTQTR
ncbi:MAG: FecR domain-containing protein [Kofleriaceae bacterium]|nr:FecR domain-containing protein [Kofleriaceae bacterium]MBP9170480.1 FecR domain-containing protein [Kofleriaceae bacterium]MBP9859534.1 FecR domain-containing protein [Kofleriaceae bacterium]